MAVHPDPQFSPEQLDELCALADGTLPPDRRPQIKAMIAASTELTLRYEEQRRVLERFREAEEHVRAPARLRAQIQAQTQRRRSPSRRRVGFAGALTASLAAAVIAIAWLLPGGTLGSPTLSQAAALATRGPVQAPPAPDPDDPGARLAQEVDDVYFPNWAQDLGWRATGQRTDRLSDHRAVTVYYRSQGRRLAYTIVSAPALAQPAAAATEQGGLKLRTVSLDGRVIVTWRRDGKTCVLTGTQVTGRELRQLAAWTVTPGAR
jgi:anti-sigma factor RsiW